MKSKFHYWQCIKKLEFFSETKVILTGYYQKTKKRRKENILLQLCSCSYLYGFWKNNHINCWPKCVKFFLNISCRPHVVENKLHNLQLNCDINELFWWKEEASLSSMLYIYFFLCDTFVLEWLFSWEFGQIWEHRLGDCTPAAMKQHFWLISLPMMPTPINLCQECFSWSGVCTYNNCILQQIQLL